MEESLLFIWSTCMCRSQAWVAYNYSSDELNLEFVPHVAEKTGG